MLISNRAVLLQVITVVDWTIQKMTDEKAPL